MVRELANEEQRVSLHEAKPSTDGLVSARSKEAQGKRWRRGSILRSARGYGRKRNFHRLTFLLGILVGQGKCPCSDPSDESVFRVLPSSNFATSQQSEPTSNQACPSQAFRVLPSLNTVLIRLQG